MRLNVYSYSQYDLMMAKNRDKVDHPDQPVLFSWRLTGFLLLFYDRYTVITY